jgi:hypothetical protein
MRQEILSSRNLHHVGCSWGCLGGPALPTLEGTNVTLEILHPTPSILNKFYLQSISIWIAHANVGKVPEA